MSDHNDIVNEPLIRDAIKLIGPLPAIGGFTSLPAGAVDPRAVAAEVIGFDLNLNDRNAAIEALTRAFPARFDLEKQKFVITRAPVRDQVSFTRGALPVVGEMAVAVVALRALAEHAGHLDDIAEVCSDAGCDPEALITVIERLIHELVVQFEDGHPITQAVDSLLLTLAGFDTTDPKKSPVDVSAVDGYLGQLKKRCKIDPSKSCGIKEEQGVTSFTTLVSLTAIFANAWAAARPTAIPSKFFAVNLHEVHQHLFAVVATLDRLRHLVDDRDWVTTEIPTTPPITAAAGWDWMRRYSAVTARELLNLGPEGKYAVSTTMTEFEGLVNALRNDSPTGCGLRAFGDDEVRDVLNDLLCHIGRVKAAL